MIHTKSICCSLMIVSGLVGNLPAQNNSPDVIQGYTAPFQEIRLSAAEPGLLTEISVKEGDSVNEGDVVARLNHKVLLKSLAVADKEMNSNGNLKSARAELRLREDRLIRLQGLKERGHASEDEIQTATAERDVAKARLLAAEETLEVKRLEHKRIQAQLERRFVRAPFGGVITQLDKKVGEFVPANDPSMLTMVQLDPLIATFTIPPDAARKLTKNQSVSVQFPKERQPTFGNVTFVSPVNDAESGEVRIKVEIPNPTQKLRAGTKVSVELDKRPPRTRNRSRPRNEIGSRDLPTITPRASVKR